MRLQGIAHDLLRNVQASVRVDDGADGRIERGLVRGDDAHVAAHDLHVAQAALQGAVSVQHKTLGPYAHDDVLVGNARRIQRGVRADENPAAFHPAGKRVNGRRAQELGDKQVVRVVIDLLRRADLLDNALPHDHNHVGNAHGLLLVVGHKDGGDARFRLNAADFLAGLQAQARVQVGQRLVQQQHAGHFHQRAGDGHALLLAAGQLVGLAVHEGFNLYQLRGVLGAVEHGFFGHFVLAFEVLQREEDVLLDGHVGIERIVLKHQANAAVFRGQLGHIVVPEKDSAAGGLLQAANHVQRGAFPASGGAEQANELAVRDGEGKVADRHDRLVGLFVPAGENLGQVLQNNFHTNPYPFVKSL